MALFKARLIKQIKQTLDLIYPISCLQCGKSIDSSTGNGVYCPDCRPDPPPIKPVGCPTCQARLPDQRLILNEGCYCCIGQGQALAGIVTLGRYHDNEDLGKMILAMKHGGKTWYGREFGAQLARSINEQYRGKQWDAIVPVPLHYTRRWKRGFNQASVIAGFLADELETNCYNWLLKRVRLTRPQSGGRLKRQDNVSNAFAAGGICKNADLVLVDDVVTTGATIRESARILFGAGARSVLVAACAWVPMGHPVHKRKPQ